MSIADEAYGAGRAVLLADRKTTAAVVNDAFNHYLAGRFNATSGFVVGTDGKRSAEFGTVVHEHADALPAIEADKAAIVVDVLGELTVEALRAAYVRISEAKALKKTPVPKGQQRTNITLGIIYAPESPRALEIIAAELTALNKDTEGRLWPDMIVVGTTGVINYAVQFPGEGVSGDYLPPTEGAFQGGVPAFYVVPVMLATGDRAFSKMLAFSLAHLGIFSAAAREHLPNWSQILEGVPKSAVTLGGYQYNLVGDLVPVPREHYNDRYLAARPLLIEDSKGTVLSAVQFLPWQDGAAILLQGKLPLDGLLIFMPREKVRGAIIKRGDVQISYVLPITQDDFRSWLQNVQLRSNMRIKSDPGQFVIQKLADEGASSPFMARIFLGVLKLREQVFPVGPKRDRFDKRYEFVTAALSNARTFHRKTNKAWNEHREKVDSGEIAKIDGRNIRILESVDADIRADTESFINAAVRCLKAGMQDVAQDLGVEIGFLFKKPPAFAKGIETLKTFHPDLAEYLLKVREWSEPLLLARNDLEHSAAILPKIAYSSNGNKIVADEPTLSGKPMTEAIGFWLDRLCCFVEEFTTYCLSRRLPGGLALTEIALADRVDEIPERFQLTLATGGLPKWRITSQASTFEET